MQKQVFIMPALVSLRLVEQIFAKLHPHTKG